jgi:hypothetical protein
MKKYRDVIVWVGGGESLLNRRGKKYAEKEGKIYDRIVRLRNEKKYKWIGILSPAPELMKLDRKDIDRALDDGIPLFIDSGGYLIWSRGLDISYEDLMKFYEEIEPTCASTLDIPTYLQIPKRKRLKIVEKNIERSLKMRNLWRGNYELIASIQSKSSEEAKKEIPSLINIGYEAFGFGGYVSSLGEGKKMFFGNDWRMRQRPTNEYLKYNFSLIGWFMAWIKYLKEEYLNDRWLHLYGVYGAKRTLLFYLSYVDSWDSVIWKRGKSLYWKVLYKSYPPYSDVDVYKGVYLDDVYGFLADKLESYIVAVSDMISRGRTLNLFLSYLPKSYIDILNISNKYEERFKKGISYFDRRITGR